MASKGLVASKQKQRRVIGFVVVAIVVAVGYSWMEERVFVSTEGATTEETATTLVTKTGEPCSFRDALEELQKPGVGAAFSAQLAAAPYKQFYWECPPVSAATLETTPFQCLVIGRPRAYPEADPDDFHAFFKDDQEAIAFPNLGRDAVLVAPCPRGDESLYGHLAAFVRLATPTQQDRLWALVATSILDRITQLPPDTPLWLSTEGSGVPWLHVRIDSRPKYYKTRSFRIWPPPVQPL